MAYYKTIQVNKKQVRLHRYLMEQKLGRKLNPNELVHHKDGNKFNNDIDNLELIDRKAHMKAHPEVKQLATAAQTKHDIKMSEILDLYVEKGFPARIVAERTGIPIFSIHWFIRKHGIKHKTDIAYA